MEGENSIEKKSVERSSGLGVQKYSKLEVTLQGGCQGTKHLHLAFLPPSNTPEDRGPIDVVSESSLGGKAGYERVEESGLANERRHTREAYTFLHMADIRLSLCLALANDKYRSEMCHF